MRSIFIMMICIFLLSSCAVYLGTYYNPTTNYGDVVLVGSCGDETPSGVAMTIEGVKIEITADDITDNDMTFVWVTATSKTPFDMSSPPKVIKFVSDNQNITIQSLRYNYKLPGKTAKHVIHNDINGVPGITESTTILHAKFVLNYHETFTLIMSGMSVSGQKIKDIIIDFKNTKKIRSFSIGKC